MKHRRNESTRTMSLLRVLLLLLIVGCSDDGPQRYQVSGTATYAGQPIPKGKIVFEPDGDAGGQGPQARAVIDQGRYETLPDEGAVPGPHTVMIVGYDGIADIKGGSPDGKSLFPTYQTKVILPDEDATQDFDVPSATAR